MYKIVRKNVKCTSLSGRMLSVQAVRKNVKCTSLSGRMLSVQVCQEEC